MGTKNNPKNRGATAKGKLYNGKEVEPIEIIDPINGKKFISAKVAKTNDIIFDENNNPVKWKDIIDER